MLKDLFLTSNLPHILQNIQPFFSPAHFLHLIKSFNAFLLCADYQKAFVSFACPQCGLTHKFPITCKTRLCPTCGYKYAKAWAHKMSQTLLNVPHRHILFTIPKEARPFFCYDRELLHHLALGVKHILDYQFQQKHKKTLRKKKIGKYSKYYFTNSDILHYGLITVIHTFGRDLKWNPHIHALVSMGGFTKQWKWKKFDYFSVDVIANQWKFIVLHAIQSGNYRNAKWKKQAQEVANKLYKQDARLFFSVGKQEVNNPKGLLKYLGRYLARSPIANYKITEVTDTHVTFFFHDLKNEKKKTYLTFGQHPFLCPNCHIPMRKKEIYICIRWYGRKIHVLYPPKN
ncbi:hypothetical protein IX293_000150 [Fusobacterium necrophorum]|nr:transposase [Fusobacterium necrophorum]MBR8821920.1 hypothetical protein [Fusobacterium necrophorum]